MKKRIIISGIAAAFVALAFTGTALAVITPPSPSPDPTVITDCKKDGWKDFYIITEDQEQILLFKNQGDCVSFVSTDGNNEPDGPPQS